MSCAPTSTELELDGAVVVASTVEKFVSEPADSPYDIVFLDPPYSLGSDRLGTVLRDLRRNGWLAEKAIVVVERASRDGDFAWPDGFVPSASRRYGEGTPLVRSRRDGDRRIRRR